LAKVSDTYQPLTDVIGDDDVVLAPYNASVDLPAFTGKLVASEFWENPLAVRDVASRRKASKQFFDADTSVERRREIVDEYGVRWIVIASDDDAVAIEPDLEAMGAQVVYRNDGVVVLRAS
jgi:hypothetical protein